MAGKIIYGLNAVREALASGHHINRVYFAHEGRAKAFDLVVAQARDLRVPFDFVPQAKLNELTGTLEHQGIAAAVSPVEYTPLDECLAACPRRALLLALDQVQHPRNLGLLIRTAAGAGASGVLAPARGGALLDDTVLRFSAGAVFRVPVVRCGNMTQALRALRKEGFWIYGLDATAQDSIFTQSWPDRCAFVVGNESQGLRPIVRKVCDACLRIPLAGSLDSLNVAVAAGIALFHVAAQWQR